MGRRLVPTARIVRGVEPGSVEWLKTASASKVAAMLGLSPWESPFSLWHRMAGNITADPATDVQTRGHYLEPALRQWFADQHPDRTIRPGLSFAHADRPWQTAAPDGLIVKDRRVTGLLECKTALLDWEWGEPGTDEVPPYYRVQALWQMDCTGIPVVAFAVLTSHWEFRQYIVRYDPAEADQIRSRVVEFMASLAEGRAPGWDSHAATYRALRDLHPDIDDVDAEIDPATAIRFHNAACAAKYAEEDLQEATNAVAHAMGTARRAVLTLDDGFVNVLATRQARAGGKPFVKRSNTLTNTFTLTPKKAAS